MTNPSTTAPTSPGQDPNASKSHPHPPSGPPASALAPPSTPATYTQPLTPEPSDPNTEKPTTISASTNTTKQQNLNLPDPENAQPDNTTTTSTTTTTTRTPAHAIPRSNTDKQPMKTEGKKKKKGDTNVNQSVPSASVKVADQNQQGGESGGKPAKNGKNEFEDLSIEEAFGKLGCTPEGLTAEEEKKRQEQYGLNKMPEESRSKILAFLGFMWNPLSWAMEAAAIIAVSLHDFADFALILCLLLLNATVAFYEESTANDAIASLKKSLAPNARILRAGKITVADATELVPGDVIEIKIGDVVPADVKLIGGEGAECMFDQSALTGESRPVKKGPGQVAYSGSTVKRGDTRALVYATGPNTFFGKTAELIGETTSVGHLQHVLTMIGGGCLITIFVWVVIELGVQFGVYGHTCGGGEGGCPTLSNMLVVVVGGIPIAMPTVLSVTLALGAFKLAQKGAIVSRLTAIEELAGMDMLCSDKTGTLTLNQLSVDKSRLYPVDPYTPEDILKYAALGAKPDSKDSIDVCILHAYDKMDTLWGGYECKQYIPFNPVDKRTVAVISEKATGRVFRTSKGAPQVVLRLAHNYDSIRKDVEGKVDEYAHSGYRALGVGIAEGDGKNGEDKWNFVGLIPMYDPPRGDTKETIGKCVSMGIGVKMITGDQLPIGVETAKQLGMKTNLYTPEVFSDQEAAYAGLDRVIEQADGFAEVYPEHKFEIVRRLQDLGYMVGMTGDGVNDAPALKRADIGIAVSDSTDAARSAADIVLTQPGLSVIVEAVTASRKIFQRMKNYAIYTVSTTYRLCFTLGLLTVIYNFYFPTILVVLLAVFNDGAMIALSKDRVTPSPHPNSWRLGRIFGLGLIYGLYLTLSSWILFYVASHTGFFPSAFGIFDLTYVDAQRYCGSLPFTPNSGAACVLAANIPAGSALGSNSFLIGPGSISAVYPNQFPDCNPALPSALAQCVAEVTWERQSRLRALLFAHLSISGQALIFVTRTHFWSFLDRPGTVLFAAVAIAQLINCLIAGFGFGGYRQPQNYVPNCFFCEHFTGRAPLALTESIYTASVIGCGWYVLVAWVWSILWYLLLDPIKFVTAWLLQSRVPNPFYHIPIVAAACSSLSARHQGPRTSSRGSARRSSRASRSSGSARR